MSRSIWENRMFVKRCYFMINDSNECVVNKKKSTHKYKLYTNLMQQCVYGKRKKNPAPSCEKNY